MEIRRQRMVLVRTVILEGISVLTLTPARNEASDSLKIKQVEEQVSALRTSVICAFNQLLDLKDLNTGVHSTRLAEWGMRVGQELGLEEPVLQNLEIAALLHDIGKVGVPDAILRKHETFDGKGYPAGLKETEVPIVSRIVSVIDAFDAMVSSRPYRRGLPFEEAVRRLIVASGTQFDPVVVQCFLSFAQTEMAGVFAAAGTSVSSAL